MTSADGTWVSSLPLLSEFAVYSSSRTDVRDSATIRGAGAGSNTSVEVGCDAVVNGPVLSGGSVFLRERARIEGDLVAHTTVQRQNNVVVTGTTTQGVPTTGLAFGGPKPVAGTVDVIVPNGGTRHLTPGAYRDVTVNSRATLTLAAGEYQFRRLVIEPDTVLVITASDVAPVTLAVAEELRIGDRTRMTATGSTTPLSLRVNTAQTTQVYLGTDTQLFGSFFAADASVEIAARARITGAVYGAQVTVQPGAVVCRPPSLLGLEHSEGAYAPAFDPSVSRYTAVVPAGTTHLTVTAPATPGVTVTLNGAAPGTPVPLEEGTTPIDIALTGSPCGAAHYELLVTRSAEYVLHVDADSPALPAAQDGRTWETAFSNLQHALAVAAVQGKEIHVAGGLYRPYVHSRAEDPRSATFAIGPGIEVEGGYAGTEPPGAPATGTPMDVVLSGDLSSDDPIDGWPLLSEAQLGLLSENARHVVTVRGNSALVGPTLRSLTIRGGAADADGEDGYGGGIYAQYAPPTLESCIVERNYARAGGAGLYAVGGPKRVTESLFENNLVQSGSGAAVFVRGARAFELAGVVLHSNASLGAGVGAALFAVGSSVTVSNTLAVRNTAGGATAAMAAASGALAIVNCTIADNTTSAAGSSDAVGAYDGATLTLRNTILWNAGLSSELGGAGAVTYSCVRGGAPGAGNISTAPSFVDSTNPRGADAYYGTHDDGYQLTPGSAGVDAAEDSVAPPVDLALIPRPWGAHADMGAYEYEEYEAQPNVFGRLEHGTFVPSANVPVIDYIYDGKLIGLYAASTKSRVIRVAVPKNRKTKDRQSGYLYLQGLDTAGAPLAGSVPVRIQMYRVGSDDQNLYFQSLTPTQGKRIVFVGSPWFQNVAHPTAYVVYAKTGAAIKVDVPLAQ